MNHQSPPAWALWSNPIFHRYRRSRLRLGKLIPWSVCTLILATFTFLVPYTVVFHHVYPGDQVSAARTTLMPMLVLQGFILMLLGTFSIASGITRESSEGILDYQRLTPMTPLAKMVGYLFGLPIREYLLVGLTLPFTIYAAFVGEVPATMILEVYAVFFSASLLYHMSGFLAGTVVKHKMLAGVISQVIIFTIYWVLPSLSKVGFPVFHYFTLFPVLNEKAIALFPQMAEQFEYEQVVASFFNWEFNPAPFSVIVQLSLFTIFGLIVHRHWRNPANHLLGKHTSVLTYALCLLALLGSAAPLIKTGLIFISKSIMEREFGQSLPSGIQPEDAFLSSAIFGAIALILALGIAVIITPSTENYRKGLRRTKKLGLRKQPLGADSAIGTWHTLVILAFGAICWCWFTREIGESGWISRALPQTPFLALTLALSLPILGCQLILEYGGKKYLLMWLVFAWVVPVFGAIVLAIVTPDTPSIPIYLASFSGFSLIPYAAQEAFPFSLREFTKYKDPIQHGLWLGIAFQVLVIVGMATIVTIQKLKMPRT